ncbi:MAG TPA: hypothetical protein VFU19_08070 [Iamia sp.]|nr:hypothetical protein [Iamia sp.]
MRARRPVTRVEARHLTVRTEVEAADGTALPPLVVRVPVEHADMLDPSATPGAVALVTAAAARGEDLVVEGPVDEAAVSGLVEMGRLMSDWWGTGATRVEIEDPTAVEGRAGDGVGLFFTRGVDSTSTLLDLLDEPPGDRVTHLLTVYHGDPAIFREVQAQRTLGHEPVARALGLPLVVLETSIRSLLDPFRIWGDTSGPALIATGLQVGAGFRRLVLSGAHSSDVHTRTGADPDLIEAITTSRTHVVLGNPGRSRDQRVAHLRTSPLARAHLQVCWEGFRAGNCGRCRKCQLTMASLLLAGDPDPAAGFDAPLDPALLGAAHIGPELATFAAGMIEGLPPEAEDLRRALSDAWDRSRGAIPAARWGDDAPPALAGRAAATRVAAARRAATGAPHAPAVTPLGWRDGATPLHPAHADRAPARALAEGASDRPCPWAVVEPAADAGPQLDLARILTTAHGPGITYVPGTASDPTPALGPDAVGSLLRAARVRAWWRAGGDLDPLRVVETVEHGCLPIQVMPGPAARDLRSALPAAVAALVVAEDEVAGLDLSPAGVAARLGPALDHLLAAPAEHDLAPPSPNR